jgi:L-arabonate dehydrase
MNNKPTLYHPEKPERSRDWFEPLSVWGMMHRGWMSAAGFSPELLDGRPVVGIANSWSEANSCNMNLRTLAEAVKRGIWQAGGIPIEFPTISLGEILIKPTTMLYRNLMAMEIEESITAHPFDSVVLLSGCDKTTPAALMGAVSANVPALILTSGPMLRSSYRGRELGAGHDVTEYLSEHHAGQMTRQELCELESCIARSIGHCTVMGTASTMACLLEALGLTLPGTAALPAPDSRRLQLAERTGRQAVAIAQAHLTPGRIITPAALTNAIKALHAIGGSTNAVIHLIALARRLGYALTPTQIDQLGRDVPLLVNLRPSGAYLMEDLFQAGGMPAVLKELAPLLDTSALTITGATLAEQIEQTPTTWNREVIRAYSPTRDAGAIRVVRGTLCPDGAVIKQSAATPALLTHSGPAYVFEDYEELQLALNDPDLPVTRDHILVLRGAGPVGAPGMPEWGVFGVPLKLFREGVRDIVRISDARASGTSHGTIVVHAAPEAAVGGPLALVETGDTIVLDVPAGRLDLLVAPDELARRRAGWVASQRPERGYRRLFYDHVTQAHEGVDFDFLTPAELRPFPLPNTLA